MKNRTEKQLYDLLINDDFIKYVIHPDRTLAKKWEEYFKQHPEKVEIARRAKSIIIGENELVMPAQMKEEIKTSVLAHCKPAKMTH